jgi:hypothetical protein
MQLCDLLPTQQIIIEWGSHGFPGFGRGLFSQRHYRFMVDQLNYVHDAHAKQWLTDWLAEAFRRDNPRFKEELFKRAAAEGRQYSASPEFQQRHFYYLAELVREIDDPAIHEFVANWLADTIGRSNYKFKRSLWDRHVARPQPMTEGPAFGRHSHRGFGKKLFTRSHYAYIANSLHDIHDEMVRDHLSKWFSEAFKLDNPAFNPEAFEAAVLNGTRYTSPPWQQRHFYYLAHEVADVDDPHQREFLCDWLAKEVGSQNPYFNDERWREYCNLSPKSYQRQVVQHTRATARGDADIPEHPYARMQREEREAGTQVSAEEFHQHATCYAEHRGELAGHDLAYFRKQDGEYVLYDKTTGREYYCTGRPDAYGA